MSIASLWWKIPFPLAAVQMCQASRTSPLLGPREGTKRGGRKGRRGISPLSAPEPSLSDRDRGWSTGKRGVIVHYFWGFMKRSGRNLSLRDIFKEFNSPCGWKYAYNSDAVVDDDDGNTSYHSLYGLMTMCRALCIHFLCSLFEERLSLTPQSQ